MPSVKEFFKKLRKKASAHGFVCDACKAELFDYPHHRLCEDCQKSLESNDLHTCPKCGRKTVTEGVCLTCKSVPPLFDEGVSPFVYRHTTAALINRIKNGERRLAYFFGEELAKTLLQRFPALKTQFEAGRYETSGEKLLILPVPLTQERQIERGYNQSQELCEVLTDELNRLGILAEMDEEVLIKHRETALQKKLGFVARMDNVSGAYRVHKRKACEGKTIVLVDDVMTTGATGSEIAELILNAGAKRVLFLTAAARSEKL